MQTNVRGPSLIYLFSPRTWLRVAILSGVLATGSGLILVRRDSGPKSELLGHAYDAVERFFRDTIRLSFTSRTAGGARDAVFVAPKGILDKEMLFNWIESAKDYEPKPEDVAIEPVAPPRLLDPTWQPDFSPPPKEKEAQ
jgi:hypothetical protein